MRYRAFLTKAATQEIVGPLVQARNRNLQVVHNRPGAYTCGYPITADLADLMDTWNSGVRVYRWNWRASRAAAVSVWDEVWNGVLYNIDEDISGNLMSLSFVGHMQRLEKRLLRRQKIYSNQDDGDIILDLLAEANLKPQPDGYNPSLMTGASTLTTMTPGQKLGDDGTVGAYRSLLDPALGGAGRNKTYPIDTPILQEMIAWSDLENGCDIRLDKNRALNIYRKKQIVREGAVFGFGTVINNISALSRQIDGSTLVNYLIARASGVTPQFVQDLTSQAAYGFMEEVATLSGSGATAANTLLAYAGAEVALRSFPRVLYSLTPFPYTVGSAVPEPFVDYDVGDRVYLTARRGKRVNIQNQAQRVFGINVAIDDNGGEKLSALQFTPGS